MESSLVCSLISSVFYWYLLSHLDTMGLSAQDCPLESCANMNFKDFGKTSLELFNPSAGLFPGSLLDSQLGQLNFSRHSNSSLAYFLLTVCFSSLRVVHPDRISLITWRDRDDFCPSSGHLYSRLLKPSSCRPSFFSVANFSSGTFFGYENEAKLSFLFVVVAYLH